MLDLKTGRFVIDAEKGWELHPFMSRQEFFYSALFKSKYPHKGDREKRTFNFGKVFIDGYEMFMLVTFGGLHDCVERVTLVSVKMTITDINNMPSNWKEIAYEVKRTHDEFLQKQMEVSFADAGSDKDHSFMLPWGDVRSDFSLRYDIPSAEVVISYRNRTEEDDAMLEKLGDKFLW